MKIQHEYTVTEEILIPGNMTQYDLSIGRRPDRSVMLCLYDSKARHSGRVMVFDYQGIEYSPEYVAEKMRCGIGDAGVLLVHLQKNYGINIHLDNRFNPETGVWIGYVVQ